MGEIEPNNLQAVSLLGARTSARVILSKLAASVSEGCAENLYLFLTLKPRMPVTLDGFDYPSTRLAFMALGLSKAQRHELGKELRRTAKVEITFTHVIQKREP